MSEIIIRESAPHDLDAVVAIYSDTFTDENLVPLVKMLLDPAMATTSLVAVIDEFIVGHVVFTDCDSHPVNQNCSLLGPLAVASAWQGQGVGNKLVKEGFRLLSNAGIARVFVLGDPGYYGRFGFEAESGISPPYPLPTEWQGAWQSIGLSGGSFNCPGTLSVPKPWQDPALWSA